MREQLLVLAFFIMALVSCGDLKPPRMEFAPLDLNEQEKSYWYSGEAELNSYHLEQARYGEMHEGNAVLIFVTEPFNLTMNCKPNDPADGDVSVMKVVQSRKFETGIYPYSLMSTNFLPFEGGNHSLKVSTTSQEWCGHTYMELQNRGLFDVTVSSYFENESKTYIGMPQHLLEDDFWAKIRLDPSALPTGSQMVVPSFFFLRLKHKSFRAHLCQLTLTDLGDSLQRYEIDYPEIPRQLAITFEKRYPHRILSWEETYYSGFSGKSKKMTTRATLKKTIQTDYWNRNQKEDSVWRDSLRLKG